MSLFPAYAATPDIALPPENPETVWLKNPSFQISLEKPAEETPAAEPHKTAPKKPKKEKHHKHRAKKEKIIIEETRPESNDIFCIDKTRTKEYLTVTQIFRPAAPRYHIKYYITPGNKGARKKKFKRYYRNIFRGEDDKSNTEETPVVTKKTLSQLGGSTKDDNFAGFKQEEELSQTTAVFNKKLAEDTHDIKVWLEYVKFQDTVYHFEKTYRKGSIAKGLRVLAERKLAILDKALTHNLNCEELLRERLNVCVSIYPADELQVQLKSLVDKEQSNIILWQGYIESTQCSMSHCNTPSVLDLYNKCLAILHKLRRTSTMEKAQLEENILRILYQCGLFLKQAGLFEQLWTLLRLYLELNLSPSDKNKFNITSGFQEKHLVELEEVVFTSQLPLHELWLRTEKLRESCHWLPYTDDGACEDPQRLVFTEDVAELIHPITMPENTFKLVSTILTLLKIPLLPCRHTTMQDLGLDYVPWALDSIESLLPIFLPLYPIDLRNDNLIVDQRLSVGPQYLKVLPGQEEYLDFVIATMLSCAQCLTGDDRTATTVWWMRFQRLLIILERQNRFKLPQGYAKKIKGNLKKLLKSDENRNNMVYYCEYALVEFALGNTESCFKVIQTALDFGGVQPIVANANDDGQAARCHLHRVLIEVHLKNAPEKHDPVLNLIVSYVLERNEPVSILSDSILAQASLKLKNVTLQLMQGEMALPTVSSQFLPNFATDWIIINAWFTYLTQGPLRCGTFLEGVLAEWGVAMMYQKEVLFEFYVAVLYKHCVAHPGFGAFKILDEVLYRAIESYPNNLFLLSVLAKEQSITSCSGAPWWKVKGLLLRTGRAFPALFLVIIANQQIVEAERTFVETFTGRPFEVSGGCKNRMLALFRRITKADMCTRRCGLVWRLYLQFVHAHLDPKICRNVYYSAVEECCWLKSLYIDAAIYIPAELAQIQDLLMEKQLRLHVTPEELDVLRS